MQDKSESNARMKAHIPIIYTNDLTKESDSETRERGTKL